MDFEIFAYSGHPLGHAWDFMGHAILDIRQGFKNATLEKVQSSNFINMDIKRMKWRESVILRMFSFTSDFRLSSNSRL